MALAIPGARSLFSHIQAALWSMDTTKRIRASRHVHATLEDFHWLAATLNERPTRLQELVATSPSTYGTTNAVGTRMGVCCFHHDTSHSGLWLWPVTL